MYTRIRRSSYYLGQPNLTGVSHSSRRRGKFQLRLMVEQAIIAILLCNFVLLCFCPFDFNIMAMNDYREHELSNERPKPQSICLLVVSLNKILSFVQTLKGVSSFFSSQSPLFLFF